MIPDPNKPTTPAPYCHRCGAPSILIHGRGRECAAGCKPRGVIKAMLLGAAVGAVVVLYWFVMKALFRRIRRG